MRDEELQMSADEIHTRLMEAARERLEAEYAAKSADDALDRAVQVGAAVTELAVLHGQIYGRNIE
jgi:hypothetical protein